MAGYSATPQARKLGVKPGIRLGVVDRPAGWAWEVEPHEVDDVAPGAAADVLLWFVPEAARLAGLPALAEQVFPTGAVWVVWPRKAAGHVSDVDENLIRSTALDLGLVDVKVAAIDTDWSGLKLVWRKENRTPPG